MHKHVEELNRIFFFFFFYALTFTCDILFDMWKFTQPQRKTFENRLIFIYIFLLFTTFFKLWSELRALGSLDTFLKINSMKLKPHLNFKSAKTFHLNLVQTRPQTKERNRFFVVNLKVTQAWRQIDIIFAAIDLTTKPASNTRHVECHDESSNR